MEGFPVKKLCIKILGQSFWEFSSGGFTVNSILSHCLTSYGIFQVQIAPEFDFELFCIELVDKLWSIVHHELSNSPSLIIRKKAWQTGQFWKADYEKAAPRGAKNKCRFDLSRPQPKNTKASQEMLVWGKYLANNASSIEHMWPLSTIPPPKRFKYIVDKTWAFISF